MGVLESVTFVSGRLSITFIENEHFGCIDDFEKSVEAAPTR